MGVLLLGLAFRLIPWRGVFTPEGVRFFGSDPYYHVMRAKRIVQNYPHVPWDDPMMNYPEGAPIFWPPLFDQIIATVSVALGGRQASPEFVEVVSAITPAVLGAMTLPLVAVIGWLLIGPEAGIVAALVVSILPAHVEHSMIGRPDQHVAETLLSSWVFLTFIAGWRRQNDEGVRGWRSTVLFSLGITLAFWNWNGSVLYLALLVSFTALWHLIASPGDQVARRSAEVLALGCGLATVLIAVSILLWGPAGALDRMTLAGITRFHLSLTALTAAFGGLLLITNRIWPRQTAANRLLKVVISTGGPLAVVLLLPGFYNVIASRLIDIGRYEPWYSTILEWYPLFFSGTQPLGAEVIGAAYLYGLGLVCMPFVIIPLVKTWQKYPEKRHAVIFLLLWGCSFLLFALLRRRFSYYFVIPLSIWLALGWRSVAETLRRHQGRQSLSYMIASIILLLVLLPGGVRLMRLTRLKSLPNSELVSTLKWLREQKPYTDREGVLAGWGLGHFIEYFAEKPVIVNPFGTELGRGPMEDAAAFFLAQSYEIAEEVLVRRRIGFVLLNNPERYLVFSGYLPLDSAPASTSSPNKVHGSSIHNVPRVERLLVTNLFFFDGITLATHGANARVSFRLLYESPSFVKMPRWKGHGYKVFGVVPGAEVVVYAMPGNRVTTEVSLKTNLGRQINWRLSLVADEKGRVALRLPYATGINGSVVTIGPYRITDGNIERFLELTNKQIQEGDKVEVKLR
jgi:dolichyl-diphosphooligosaccharide--protein glycosyltransferase